MALGHFSRVDARRMVVAALSLPNFRNGRNCDAAFGWHALRFDVVNRCDWDGSAENFCKLLKIQGIGKQEDSHLW